MNAITMLRCFSAIGFISSFVSLAAGVCPVVPAAERQECGFAGIPQDACLLNDCCFDDSIAEATWCFHRPAAGAALTTYVRWGRTVCDGDAQLVYKGYAAGGKYTDAGTGANFLCLHETAQYTRPTAGHQDWYSSIYGVTYQHCGVDSPISQANSPGGNADSYAAPCAVCSANRAATLMVPARNECPAGWTKEYSGIIMADHASRARNEYLCWDEALEASDGPRASYQALVYPTELYCGSLPCGKFAEGNELACVVCTK